MKRWIAFAIIVSLGIAALVWSERHPVDVRVTPESLLYFIADSEWEMSRLPMAATRLSDQEEIDIGNQLAANNSWYLQRNSDLTPGQKRQIQGVGKYVSRVGAKVAARAHRKLPYKFHYIPNADFVNAFALPGGHVYIGAGLMALMDSEDELAAVLGHEVEHIDHYHCAERVQTEQRLRRIPLGSLMEIPISLFEAGYSKDQELEADREGTKLAVWAGYSPLGAERMFETYDRLYQEYVRHAKSPQEELSTVAIQTLEGYFRSHPLPSERIEQIHNLINDQHWDLNQERDLEVGYIFWTERAKRAYEAGNYKEATGWAQRSLGVDPDQPIALMVLGNAQFAQANFPEAATVFAKALEKTPYDENLVETYGDALDARHTPAESLQEFENWIARHQELKWRLAPGVERAGLTLAAQGEAAAEAVVAPLKAGPNADLPAELRGRLGWWYYRAGKFDRAAELLTAAVQERPSDARMQVQLGWVLIEQHNLESAIERFGTAERQSPSVGPGGWNRRTRLLQEMRMGMAVAEWQAQQLDRALGEFAGASIAQPEWLNPQWVAALYSPGVAKTIEEMKAEQKKRRGGHPRPNGE
ncbi:MAG: M48 family metalloprotease [Terriglobia bacterium]